jgi:hypothetical protein
MAGSVELLGPERWAGPVTFAISCTGQGSLSCGTSEPSWLTNCTQSPPGSYPHSELYHERTVEAREEEGWQEESAVIGLCWLSRTGCSIWRLSASP